MSARVRSFDASLSPAARPLATLPREALQADLRAALAAGEGAAGAHCIHELWMRGEFAANIESALAQLWHNAAATVPEWLPMRYFESLPTLYELALNYTGDMDEAQRMTAYVTEAYDELKARANRLAGTGFVVPTQF